MAINGNSKKKVTQNEFIADAVRQLLYDNKLKVANKFKLEISSSIVKHLYSITIFYDNRTFTREINLDDDPFSATKAAALKRKLKKEFGFTKVSTPNSGIRMIRFE